jgi:hypothetical protein
MRDPGRARRSARPGPPAPDPPPGDPDQIPCPSSGLGLRRLPAPSVVLEARSLATTQPGKARAEDSRLPDQLTLVPPLKLQLELW